MSELVNDSTEYTPGVEDIWADLSPEERKLARRLRIQRRTEVLRRKQYEATEETEELVKKTLLESQEETSENQLQNLLTEGNELVTNVRVANDAREIKRRAENAEDRRKRLEKLEEELVVSTEKLAIINSKWDSILESNDPLDLDHDIEQQRENCNKLIKQKDAVIEDLRKELQKQEDRFIRDQKKHREDLALLCERMDSQVAVMRRAFKSELEVIEEVVGVERSQLLAEAGGRWEALYAELGRMERASGERQERTARALEDQARAVRLGQEERHRDRKTQLERDAQLLQRELQQVKAACLLNTEKLDYNYQVLRKRDDESLVLRARQKRQLNRLQDTVNSLKEKIADKAKHVALEMSRLTDEVKRLKCDITSVEKKGNDFTDANDKKFQQLWDLNTERAKALLDKILTVDRIVHEQQLGLDWEPPELQLLQKADLESYRSAMQVVAELFRQKDKIKSESEHGKYVKALRSEQAEELFLRQILQKLADASGFILEERLKQLLEGYTEREQTLITIDTVFSALGVQTKKDMTLLKKYFVPYCYCVQCESADEAAKEIGSNLESDDDTVLSEPSQGAESWQQQDAASSTTVELPSSGAAPATDPAGDLFLPQDALEEGGTAQLGPSRGTVGFKPSRICIEENHTLGIDEIYILRALRGFVEKFNEKVSSDSVKPMLLLGKKRTTVSRLLTAEDVEVYWNRFLQVFDSKHEELWDGLHIGLLKYRELLEDRHSLNEKTERLRVQNAELRRLLRSHMKEDNEDTSLMHPAEFVPPHDEVRMTTKTIAFQRR
ncbi:dynein regulatory complex protein 1 [Bacillus rossius redtenbacheri]|uniref:dynein regulatory complex protein 1 n=1 Tax=Bacillus rossius redtenbacheri TaxID=93214 RepID=UPI002FDE2421